MRHALPPRCLQRRRVGNVVGQVTAPMLFSRDLVDGGLPGPPAVVRHERIALGRLRIGWDIRIGDEP